jgi:hypothetical protein
MTDSRDTESVERTIPAPADAIFALLADPSRHPDIDGSGSVRDSKEPWQSRPPGVFGKISGGRIWRYELEPVDGGTRVRETWDISHEIGTKVMLRNSRVHQHTREAMEKTLANIEKLVTTT